jgi:hypothetical protein
MNDMRGQAWRCTRDTFKKMHQLLLVLIGCLIVAAFGLLSRRYPVEKAFWLLVSFPTLIFLVALADESWRGIQQLNHQLLHLAYDSSYALLLLGLILLLRAILKRKLILLVAAGTIIAAIPLAHIFITQP